MLFAVSFIWAIGGSFSTKAYKHLDNILRDNFQKLHIPLTETVFEYFADFKLLKFVHWQKAIPHFEFDLAMPYFSILVPTVDTVRYSELLSQLITVRKPTFFTGETGVGKSIIMQQFIEKNQEQHNLSPIFLNFSAQTNSLSTQ